MCSHRRLTRGGTTMADVPIQIVVAAFNSHDGASQALK